MAAVQQQSAVAGYEVVGVAGEGSLGRLYRAVAHETGDPAVVEAVADDVCTSVDAAAYVEHDLRALASSPHPNIRRILAVDAENGRLHAVYERVAGETLASTPGTPAGSTALAAQVARVGLQICAALQHAHECGVVHGSLVPEDVTLLPEGVKVGGFGTGRLAVATLPGDASRARRLTYATPERVAGGRIDARADVYSAAAILLEWMNRAGGERATCRVPFADALRRATAADVAERTPSCFDLALELAAAVHAEPDAHSPDALTPSVAAQAASPQSAPAAPVRDRRESGSIASPFPRWRAAGYAAVVIAIAAPLAWWLALASRPNRAAATPPDLRTVGGTAAPAGAATGAPSPHGAARSTVPEPDRSTASTAAVTARRLDVVSMPPGAAVAVDGRETGLLTPATLTVSGKDDRPPAIRLTKDGYAPLDVVPGVQDLEKGRAEYTMTPAAGDIRLSLRGPYPFEVRVGSRLVSRAGRVHEVTVPSGSRVRVQAPDVLLDDVVVASGAPGRTLTYSAPGLGRLSVRAALPFESCAVSVDGRSLGEPPISARPIAAGTHALVLACADGRSERDSFTVRAGQHVVRRIGVP